MQKRQSIPGRILVGVITLAIASSWACQGAGKGSTGKVLRVGISTVYPPLAFERDGEIVGIEPSLARLVGDALERPIRFETMEWDALIPALVDGRIDVIMAGMSITDARAEQVSFVEPYTRVGQMALIRDTDLARLGQTSKLFEVGIRVGYMKNTTGEQFVRQNLSHKDAVGFDSIDEGVMALRAGTIDFFIHDAPTIWRIALSPGETRLIGLYEPLTEEYLAWAVGRHNDELKSQLDALVLDWKSHGFIRPILERWVPVREVTR